MNPEKCKRIECHRCRRVFYHTNPDLFRTIKVGRDMLAGETPHCYGCGAKVNQ